MTIAPPQDAAAPAATRSRAQLWVLPLVLFLTTFSVYSMTAERSAVNTDAYAASVGAWRIATAGEPWLDGVDLKQLSGTHALSRRGTWLDEAANGHVVPHRMAGPILLGVPAYWLLGNDPDPRHFSIGPGGVAASGLSAGAVLFVFLAIRRRLPDPVALTASLVLAFATPTWSVSSNGLWTHPVTQLGLAGAAYGLARDRWWFAGILVGVGMWGRPHVAVVAALVGLGLAWSRRDVRPAIGLAVPTLTSLGLLACWNRYLYGEWSIGGAYGDSRIAMAAEGLGGGAKDQLLNYLGFLVSADRGFLVWSPIVLVLAAALIRSWKSLPDWSKWLVVGGCVYTVIQLRLNYFAGGVGFHSYRHGLELLICLAPALALSIPRAGRLARLVAPPVIALQVSAFTIGAIAEGFFLPLAQAWSDNSFWLALRSQPTVVGIWLALCIGVGLVVSVLLERRRTHSNAGVGD